MFEQQKHKKLWNSDPLQCSWGKYRMTNGSKAWLNRCTSRWISHFPSTPDYLFCLTSPCIYTVATITQHCAVKYWAHDVANKLPVAILLTQYTDFPTYTDRFLPYRHSCDVLISSSTDTLSVRYCGVRRGMRTAASSFGRSFFRTSGSLFTHLMTASNTSNRLKQWTVRCTE